MSWWIHVYSMAFGRYKLWSMINGDYKSTSNCGAHLVWDSELIILSYHDTERTNIVLVGGWPTPLKNMSSSVGMIISNIWKNENVPNHQSEWDLDRFANPRWTYG